MNYARLYNDQKERKVIIRYYIDPSVNRIVVEDNRGHSYALNTIIREQLQESLLRWAASIDNPLSDAQLNVEEAPTEDRANLLVYAENLAPGTSIAEAASVPPGMPFPYPLPGRRDAGRIYLFNNTIQTHFTQFLNPETPVSQSFTAYTGIGSNRPGDYLSYQLFLTLFHQTGYILGLAQPYGSGSAQVWEGYTQRPVVDRLPSSVMIEAPVMGATDQYLQFLYQRFQRSVRMDELTVSTQEDWLLQFLWRHRDENLHCVAVSPSSVNLLHTASEKGCVASVPSGALSLLLTM